MGCYFTLCHNTYGYSLLFYKVYMKRENAGSWDSGLEKEQILETYSTQLQNVTAWFLPPLLCLILSWFEFEIWSFESFHLDLTTWVPLGFHPSASFPALTIIPSPVQLKIIFGIFFFNEKYSFSLLNPSYLNVLQSNPNFSCP